MKTVIRTESQIKELKEIRCVIREALLNLNHARRQLRDLDEQVAKLLGMDTKPPNFNDTNIG